MTAEPTWDWHCADFVAKHIKKTIRRDIWEELGGRLDGNRTSADILRVLGVRSYKAAVTKLLGEPKPIALAMRDDIVLVRNALGICRGDFIECLDASHPIALGECAWSVRKSWRANPISEAASDG